MSDIEPLDDGELNGLCSEISDKINCFVNLKLNHSWHGGQTPNELKAIVYNRIGVYFGIIPKARPTPGAEGE